MTELETTETQIPPRFITGRCPHYPKLAFDVQVNTTTHEYNILARGSYPSPEIREVQAKRTAITPKKGSGDKAEYSAEQLEERAALQATIDELERAQLAVFHQLLSRAFGAKVYQGYGLTLDFSTPTAAGAILDDDSLPRDLRFWIRNAPIEAVDHELEQLGKNFETSFSVKG